MEIKKEIHKSIVIAEYTSVIRAEYVMGVLRDAGIACNLEGGILNVIMPYIQPRINLVIRAEDEELARRLISELD